MKDRKNVLEGLNLSNEKKHLYKYYNYIITRNMHTKRCLLYRKEWDYTRKKKTNQVMKICYNSILKYKIVTTIINRLKIHKMGLK